MAVVGRIARAHGIRGQVIVNPETDFLDERFREGAELFVQRNGQVAPLTITSVRFHRERPVIGLAGVDDMNAAIALAGMELRVPIDRLQALPSGTFYRHDLVGCELVTRDGVSIGRVIDVEGTRGSSRLVVGTARGEALVPLADSICVSVDAAGKRIVVDLPEGLLDLNDLNRAARD
jgi:16S rRNA processing protein RimM